MILTCPACTTRYRVDEREFEGSAGRVARCANCGHLWYERAPSPPTCDLVRLEHAPGSGFEAATNRPMAEAEPVPQLEIPPRPSAAIPRARSSVAGITTLVGLLAAVVIAGIVVYRHAASDRQAAWQPQAVLDWPATAPAPETGTGLVIRNIAPARTAAGLIVDGEIVNSGNMARTIPRLHIALEDGAEKIVQSKTVDPPKVLLQPGEAVRFATPFADPPDTATGVVVTFASS
jgi:predicted Zn finger-like uncharacterized protein